MRFGRLSLLLALGCSDPSAPADRCVGAAELSDPPADGPSGWVYRGLGSVGARRLTAVRGRLYAGTGDGVYRSSLKTADTLWTASGLQGRTVEALLALGADTLLAAIEISGDGGDTVSLFRTLDGGASWHAYQNGFGKQGGYSLSGQVHALSRLPCRDDVLLATGNAVVARSADLGASWRQVWGEWAGWGPGTHFVAVSSAHPRVVWAGGETPTEDPFLVKSTDRGESWQRFAPAAGGANAAYAAAVHPTAADVVFVGMEGRILRTADGGRTWQTVLRPESYPYFYGVAVGMATPSTVYAAGASNTDAPQPLVIYRSGDSGATWSELVEGTAQRGGVRDLLLVSDGLRDRLYVATEAGVYQYTP